MLNRDCVHGFITCPTEQSYGPQKHLLRIHLLVRLGITDLKPSLSSKLIYPQERFGGKPIETGEC